MSVDSLVYDFLLLASDAILQVTINEVEAFRTNYNAIGTKRGY